MTRIALYGIHGLYNYGCEAIVRGAQQLLSRTFPDGKITYYSYQPSYDRNKLSDLNLVVAPIKTHNSLVRRGLNKTLKQFKSSKRLPRFDYSEIVDNSDIIVSIGGDIYTIPEYRRAQKTYEYYSPLVQFGSYVKSRDKKLMIYGASIGPFGDYGKAVNYYSNHLQLADCIIARERECIKYLSSISVQNNVTFMPDPIFAIPYPALNDQKENAIAVNLSPLSIREIKGSSTGTEKALALFLKRIHEITDMEIILVPHVLSANVHDNDYAYMVKIAEELDGITLSHTTLTKPESLFEASRILAKCQLAISARMHCALNAAMSGTPPLFLAYSSKAVGMAQIVYGNKDMVFSLKNTDALENRLKQIMDDLQILTKTMGSAVDKYRRTYSSGENSQQLRRILAANS